MPDTIAQSCALNGSCTISEGSLKPAVFIPKLLAALAELAPAVHQQLTMPGCGFTMVPAYAMDDHTSDWWDGKECDGAIATLIEALEEHAPEGFEFRAMHGDDGTEYRYDRIEHAWPTPVEAFDRWRNQYNEPEAEPEPEECEDNDCTGCPWCDRQDAIEYKRAECLDAGVEPEAAELRAEEYADEVAQSRPCFTTGLTPKDVIDRHAHLHCTDGFFPMKLVDRAEWQALTLAWNQGIDSHLEAITERSTADASTGEVRVHVDELSVLCRRLLEIAESDSEGLVDGPGVCVGEAADDLRRCIIDCIGIEEV